MRGLKGRFNILFKHIETNRLRTFARADRARPTHIYATGQNNIIWLRIVSVHEEKWVPLTKWSNCCAEEVTESFLYTSIANSVFWELDLFVVIGQITHVRNRCKAQFSRNLLPRAIKSENLCHGRKLVCRQQVKNIPGQICDTQIFFR